jgi:flagellar biosynthetic protein FliO
MVSLFIVLAAVAGVALLVRRLVPSVRAMSGGTIEVLGRNHLSPKQSLALVRVGRRVLLIGVTAERLSMLCEIDDADEVADLLVRSSGRQSVSGETDGAGFDRVLDDAAAGFADRATEPTELVHGSSGRLVQLRGELRGLLGRLKALQEPR